MCSSPAKTNRLSKADNFFLKTSGKKTFFRPTIDWPLSSRVVTPAYPLTFILSVRSCVITLVATWEAVSKENSA